MTADGMESGRRRKKLPRVGAAAFWTKTLEEWKQSGLTQSEFCRKRGFSTWALSFWKKKLGWSSGTRAAGKSNGAVAKKAGTKRRKKNFRKSLGKPFPRERARLVPVEIISGDKDCDVVEIRLCSGRVLRVSEDIDPDALERIVDILESYE